MDNQTNKEFEEILLIKEQRKAAKTNRILNIVKYVITAIVSAIFFYIVTRPESLLNRKASEETINRERAKLLLDLLKENDLDKIEKGFEIIRFAYRGTDSLWFNSLYQRLHKDAIEKLQEEYEKLKNERENLQIKLIQASSDNQIRKIEIDFRYIDFKVNEIKDKLKKYSISAN